MAYVPRKKTQRKCSKCDSPVYAKGLCKYHYYSELNKRNKQKKRKLVKIAKESEKTKSLKRLYTKVRKTFFQQEENQVCHVRVDGFCTIQATDVHHKAGRLGELLTNTSYFLPVCRHCHRYIHDNSKWAEENGYIIHLN